MREGGLLANLAEPWGVSPNLDLSPSQLGGLGERCNSQVWGGATVANEFEAFQTITSGDKSQKSEIDQLCVLFVPCMKLT